MIRESMVDCDVVVIGAGVIGEAVTYELVSRGASVTLLDARGAGQGATQASAGMLVPYIEGFEHPLLNMAARSLQMYDGFVDRLSRDADVGVWFERMGSLQIFTAEESDGSLQAAAAHARAAGLKAEMLDANAVLTAMPELTPDAAGGLLIPEHGAVSAADLSGALSSAAIKRGARVCVPMRATRVSPRHDGIDIETDGGRIAARAAVLAAGSWSGQIAIDGVADLPVRPVRGQLLQVGWQGPPLRRIVWGPRCYLVPISSGSLLIGATVEEAGFDERTTVAGVRDLLDAACELVPQVWQSAFVAARVGLRPATTDGMPIVGRSRVLPGLVYATGHFRNGILLAPLTAKIVADLILDNHDDPLLAATSPQRFGEY